MNFKTVLLMVGLAGTLSMAAPAEEKVNVEERQVAAAATAVAAATLTKQVISGLGNMFAKANGPNNVKDITVQGRGYRVTIHDSTTATVMDRNTGISVTKTSTSSEAAVNEATNELVTKLMDLGYIDIHNLHLTPEDATHAPPACKDQLHASECKSYIADGFCTPHGPFLEFMVHNCFYSCAACKLPTF